MTIYPRCSPSENGVIFIGLDKCYNSGIRGKYAWHDDWTGGELTGRRDSLDLV